MRGHNKPLPDEQIIDDMQRTAGQEPWLKDAVKLLYRCFPFPFPTCWQRQHYTTGRSKHWTTLKAAAYRHQVGMQVLWGCPEGGHPVLGSEAGNVAQPA